MFLPEAHAPGYDRREDCILPVAEIASRAASLAPAPPATDRHAMLRILGSPTKLCDGWTRREMLRAGGLSLFGLGLSDFLHLSDLKAADGVRHAAKSFGRAKSCILLYLYGSP